MDGLLQSRRIKCLMYAVKKELKSNLFFSYPYFMTKQKVNCLINESHNSVVGVVTRLLPGRSSNQVPIEARNFYLLRNFHIRCGAHATYNAMGTGAASRR
jgi:hypothetical protein